MPTGHLRHYLERYLAPHPSRELKELFLSAAILDFATAAVMVFEPVYLISLGYGIRDVLLFFAAVYAAYFVLLPLGGSICRRHGYEHTILFSSPFLILYYIGLFATQYHPAFLVVAGGALVIQKILYWPGYHANFATYGDGAEGGREMSNRVVVSLAATVFAPVLGGIIAATLGFAVLFAAVAVLILASNIPLLRTPEHFEPRPFSYGAAMGMVFRKEHRRELAAYMGFGEELVALTLWPIFLAAVLGKLIVLGAVVSAAMLANAAVTLYVGRVSDDGARDGVLRSGTVFTVASWLARPFISGALGAFLIDGFYRISRNMVGVPLVAGVYDGGRRTSVMESVVFFEMALSLGKCLAALIGIVLVTFVPNFWPAVFVMAAIFSAMYGLARGVDKPAAGNYFLKKK